MPVKNISLRRTVLVLLKSTFPSPLLSTTLQLSEKREFFWKNVMGGDGLS